MIRPKPRIMDQQDLRRSVPELSDRLLAKYKAASPTERKVVHDLLSFLGDRRVLFNPYHLEIEHQVIHSVMQIRTRCTDALSVLQGNSRSAVAIRAIRASCRRFLDQVQLDFRYLAHDGFGDRPQFFTALGEFRALVGAQVAVLAVLYNVQIENELMSILPPPPKDGD